MFKIDDDSPTKDIMLDFLMMNTLPEVELNSNDNIAVLTTIMHDVLMEMMSKKMRTDQGVDLFCKIIDNHSIHRPPFSLEVFTKAEAKMIKQFALDSLFKHYYLYEFAFKPKVEMNFHVQGIIPDAPVLSDLLEMEELETPVPKPKDPEAEGEGEQEQEELNIMPELKKYYTGPEDENEQEEVEEEEDKKPK